MVGFVWLKKNEKEWRKREKCENVQYLHSPKRSKTQSRGSHAWLQMRTSQYVASTCTYNRNGTVQFHAICRRARKQPAFFFPELERKPRQDKTSTKDTRRQGRLNPKEPQSIQSRQSDTFTRKPHIDPKDKAKRPTVHIQLTVVGAIHQKLCFVLRIENSNFSWLSSDYREV